MDEKIKNTVKNILAIGGSIAIACALLDEIAENDGLELEKLASKESLKLLESSKEKDENKEKEEGSFKDEITELKRKLAEYESKQQEQSEAKE